VAALARRRSAIARELLLAAVKAERKVSFSMMQSNEIGSEAARKLIQELDLSDARYQA
jgi:monovalent cation/hydrogen antiporter